MYLYILKIFFTNLFLVIRRSRLDSNIVERVCFLRVHCGSKKLSLILPADEIKGEEKGVSSSSQSGSKKSDNTSKIRDEFISSLNEIIAKNMDVLVNTYNMNKKKKVKK